MKDPSNPVCRTISTLLSRIGDKWTVLVVQTLGEGPKRFNELRREIPSVSQRMLTLTLRNLERDGLVNRTVTPTIPPRVDYELTELGHSLQKPICGLATWAIDNVEAIHAGAGALRRRARQGGSRVSTAPAEVNLTALLDRGDEFARAGDPKAAMSFYQAALQAGRSAPQFDPRTIERLRSAQGFIQQRAAEFQNKLDGALVGIRAGDHSSRYAPHPLARHAEARTPIDPQQPLVFYYPYLAQRHFFERDEFDWVPEIEAATPVIRDELLGLLNRDADFRPYVEDEANRPQRQFHHLTRPELECALSLAR